jgi:hypothetical protein
VNTIVFSKAWQDDLDPSSSSTLDHPAPVASQPQRDSTLLIPKRLAAASAK